MPTCLRILAFTLLAGSPLIAQDWPQFRGPAGNGVSSATGVPVAWSATENVAWKTPIPGSGWSSPVLVNGKLYLTTAIEEGDSGAVSLRTLCLSADEGKILWNVEAVPANPEAAKLMHTKNSLASPTPIVDGDRLFVHFGHMGTAALDLDGNVAWRQQTVTYEPRHGNGGSPVAIDDLLVFSCDAYVDPFVVALDRTTGEVRWRTPRNTTAVKTFSFSTPLVIEVDGAKQVAIPGSGLIGAYDPQDGRELWRVRYGEGYSVVPRPVYAHGLLFVSSGFDKARLLAINPAGAAGDATDDHVAWTHDRGVPNTPSMLVVGDELYFVSDNGVANCLDATTGKVRWTERLEGDFSSSPVYADGRIYFQNEDGVVYVVSADKEFELLATNDLAERALASPAVTDGAIYLRTASQLWRIGE
jgi:outer membrane protein assembly factor BamB